MTRREKDEMMKNSKFCVSVVVKELSHVKTFNSNRLRHIDESKYGHPSSVP